jgi:L-serine dehydratase
LERISVFDIFKIGIGPSSSHTMGPWKAALRFVRELTSENLIHDVDHIQVWLYGSLAKTGVGHGTDIALILGLMGEHPETVALHKVDTVVKGKKTVNSIKLNDTHDISFGYNDIHFLTDQALPYHANGLTIIASLKSDKTWAKTYYSVGGGFIVEDGKPNEDHRQITMPYPIDTAEELKSYCKTLNLSIPQVVMANELSLREESEIHSKLSAIWDVMRESIFESIQKSGVLPGGLNVKRRSKEICESLLSSNTYMDSESWMRAIRNRHYNFTDTLKWVSCFAFAVNEENASFGRVVTAPTNGAAGVIPAVLMYYMLFQHNARKEDVYTFLLTAGEMGSLFKKGATISAAMGGCQAEIGVSSAMAAAGLAQLMGGNYEQVMMAAEIAMEHHLGMTCDPIGGLVQIPCIERNTMGAIKAITAAQIALASDPSQAKVTLDMVIKTMKETAEDMNSKYKETADGGLATRISVNLVEC